MSDAPRIHPSAVVESSARLGRNVSVGAFTYIGADVEIGDDLVTSGLDGIFLAGTPVAKVVQIERDTSYSFARIYCEPIAGVENFGEVMVMDPKETVAIPAELLPESGNGAGKGKGAAKPVPKKRRLKAE